MSLLSIINSRLGIGIVLGVAKNTSTKTGYKLADFAAKVICKYPKSTLVQSTRANQWVISGQKLSKEELDLQVEQTIRMTAQSIFEFYHYMHNYPAILEKVIFTPKVTKLLADRDGCGEGTIFIGPHLGNFDLGGRAIALHGYKLFVLSYPQLNSGYAWQNKLRQEIGLDIRPMSTENMREAKAYLKEGGFVVTGMERPLDRTNYYPKFFGRPAPVPTSYVRMALQTHSAIVVLACLRNAHGKYELSSSEPIYMDPYKNAQDEIERNAERVLAEGEKMIAANPTQWAMTYPVWPPALEEMP
jgi:KDO2-lipid IV(A) lauroyltransferase